MAVASPTALVALDPNPKLFNPAEYMRDLEQLQARSRYAVDVLKALDILKRDYDDQERVTDLITKSFKPVLQRLPLLERRGTAQAQSAIISRSGNYLTDPQDMYRRLFITLIVAFHSTFNRSLPVVDFISRIDGDDPTDASICCVVSFNAVRMLLLDHGEELFKVKITKTMVNKQLQQWLKQLAESDSGNHQSVYAPLFPLAYTDKKRIVTNPIFMIPLQSLLPFIREEFAVIKSNGGIIRSSVIADPSSFPIDVEIEEPEGEELKLQIARRLDLIARNSRSYRNMTEDGAKRLRVMQGRRNYFRQLATESKLEDPAFQRAAKLIRECDGQVRNDPMMVDMSSGPIEAFRGHYGYLWKPAPDETEAFNPFDQPEPEPAPPPVTRSKRKRT